MRRSDGTSCRRSGWAAALQTLAGAVLLVALGTGCGPQSVSLAELVTEQHTYDGEEIVVRGVVIDVDQEGVRRHAVVQDQEANRVEVAPFERAEPHVGSIVKVTGEFEFDPERGRVMHIESIEPVEP